MTAPQHTPETGESVSEEPLTEIRHIGALDATAHDFDGCGPAAHFSVQHSGDVCAEVFVDPPAAVFAAGSENAQERASTGVEFSPDQARRLAHLLLEAADALDGPGRSQHDEQRERKREHGE